MSDLGRARGSIEIDTSQAERAPAAMAGVAQGIERNMARVDSSLDRSQGKVNDYSRAWAELGNAFGLSLGVAGAVQLGRMTIALANNAAQAERTRLQYDVLAAGVGQNADEMLAAMRRASNGMIADQELVVSANRAMLLGVAKNSSEMGRLLEASRVLGQAMGQDVGKSFNDLVIGLGRLSPLILDNLGIANEGEQMFELYANSVGRTAESLSRAEKQQILLNKVLEAAAPLLEAEAQRTGNQADKTNQLGAAWGNYADQVGKGINTVTLAAPMIEMTTGALEAQTSWLQFLIELWQGYTGAVGEAGAKFDQWAKGGGAPPAAAPPGTPGWMTGVSPKAAWPKLTNEEVDERNQAKFDFVKGVQDINRELGQDIIEQERDYGRERADAVEDYQRQIAREERNFATNRARQEQDYLDGIADIHQDANRRGVRMAQDLARSIAEAQNDSTERVAEMREDSNKRLVDLEEDYQRDREKRARDHRDNILEAAGRLDAKAVAEAQRKFKNQEEDAKESYDDQRQELQEQLQERVEDERDNLDKRIAQANDAHRRQLADARDADAQRLADMEADFILRKKREDEDRATRLGDMAVDHQDQLDEMDRTHGERIAQINRHANEERTELDLAHKEEMIAMGVRNDAWLEEVRRLEESRKKIYNDIWNPSGSATQQGRPPFLPGAGTPIFPTPNGLPPPPLAGTSSMGMGATFTGDVHVSIGGSTGMGAGELRPLIRQVFIEALQEIAG